jgi:hypothetical protein
LNPDGHFVAAYATGDTDIAQADGGGVSYEGGVPEMVCVSSAKGAVESGFFEFGRDKIIQNAVSSVVAAEMSTPPDFTPLCYISAEPGKHELKWTNFEPFG